MIVDFYEGRDRFMVTQRTNVQTACWNEWKTNSAPSFPVGFFTKYARNVRGIPIPVPLQLTYADGTTELLPLPVEIWANNEPVVTKVIASPPPFNRSASIPHMTWRMRIGTTMCSREINTGLVTITVPMTSAAMQADRDERGRQDSLAGVESIAKALFEGWVPEGAAPNEAAAAAQPSGRDALDAFGQPFTVELSGEAGPVIGRTAAVTSVGFDGKPRTDDDLAWQLSWTVP